MIILDFNEIWQDYFVQYQLVTYSAGNTDAEGVWVPGARTLTPFLGMPPQPLDEKDLKKLEDGEKVLSLEKVYTSTPLMPRQGARDADRVIFEGTEYQVYKVDTREILGNYYKALVRKVQGDS